MLSRALLSLSVCATLISVSASPIAERSLPGDQAGSSTEQCARSTFATICSPIGDASQPIGDHIGASLIATGLPFSKGISVALKSRKTGRRTSLKWSQRDEQGISDGSYSEIVTSHQPGIFYGDLGHGFHGEGQLPCSLLDDSPNGQEDFEWLMSHYYDKPGGNCSYTNPSACVAVLTDVPPNPLSGQNSTITIKDNASVCGRS